MENIREKWKPMKLNVKKKAALLHSRENRSRNKTGGGELEEEAQGTIDVYLSPNDVSIAKMSGD